MSNALHENYLSLLEEFKSKSDKATERKLNRLFLDKLSFFEYVEKFSDRVFTGRVTPAKVPTKLTNLKRVHNLLLSDLHFGADIDGEETGVSDYRCVEEARRFAVIVRETLRYKPQYRRHTKLVIALLGDIIENQLHDARTGATTAEQCCRAIHLLLQGITQLAMSYPQVEIYCATGNHDRIMSRHNKRAVHGKHDSYATVIYYALKKALQNVQNVEVVIPKKQFHYYTNFERKIGFTHGDSILNPGNPHKSINVKALEDQVNKFNAGLKDSEEYAAIVYGHTHLCHVVHLPNGTILVGNGGLPPTDPFSTSIGSCESQNSGQVLFESVPEHIVGDLRFLRCAPRYDTDRSLDRLITPWPGFNP